MLVQLKNVRLSFPDLFEPKAFQPGQVAKFKASFLIDKKNPLVKEVEAAIKDVATAKWGAKAEGILKSIRNNPNKFCFQDGDTKTYDGYEGTMVLTASNKARPLIIDRDKTPLTINDGRPYAGCYVNANVEFFAYENSGNGIAASLSGVQFYKDGDAFSGGRAASPDDFDDISVEEDELA